MSDNVPLIPPIFTYNTEFGEVRVYVFRGVNDTFLVATLNGDVKYQYAVSDHTSYHKKRRVIEYPHAVVTLKEALGARVKRLRDPATYLLHRAKDVYEWWCDEFINPFEELLTDKEALQKLQTAIGKCVVQEARGGE
jgi:hypothetical protein